MTLNFNIATTWNELNEFQRRKITSIIFSAKETEKGVYFAVLYYLFVPNPWWTWKGFWAARKFYKFIKQVPLSEYIPYCEFIFKSLNLTKFPRKLKVMVDGQPQYFFGPADRLVNLSIEELAFTYKFYFEWRTNGSMVDLDRLVTTLYRPYSQKVKNDVREAFSEHTLSSRSKILPKIPMETKISIGFAYMGSIDLMFSRYGELFPKPKTSNPDKKPKFQSFVPMMRAMAMGENQPLGDYEKVRKTNANIFFDIAEETIKIDKKRQLEMAKLNKKR